MKLIIGENEDSCRALAEAIVVKVTRDDFMIGLDKKYPIFGFAGHKGYGASEDYKMLDNGVYSEARRKTYDLLKNWLHQGRLF